MSIILLSVLATSVVFAMAGAVAMMAGFGRKGNDEE